MGPGPVISSGSTPQSIALAPQSGAHHVFDYKRDDIAAKIARLTGGRGADAVFDATYSEAGFVKTAKTVRRVRSWVVLGVGPGKTRKLKARSTLSWPTAVPGIMEWAVRGLVVTHIGKTIDSTVETINAGLQSLKSGRSTLGKIAVIVDRDLAKES